MKSYSTKTWPLWKLSFNTEKYDWEEYEQKGADMYIDIISVIKAMGVHVV